VKLFTVLVAKVYNLLQKKPTLYC